MDAVQHRYLPDAVVALGTPENGASVPLLADRTLVDGRAAAYVCRNFVCELPATDPESLLRQLQV